MRDVHRSRRPPGLPAADRFYAKDERGTTLSSFLCLGDACKAIGFNWDADAHRVCVCNRSDRHVRVTAHGWFLSFEITLRPRELRLIDATEIELPIYAEYLL